MDVQVIQAKTSPAVDGSRLKVAAYCRVSTDMVEQESSYEAQCTHYTRTISANPAWEMAGIYADEGISGTQAGKRPEFLHMIEDCDAGKIDLILTKSISRFSRNTLDCLTYIRKLKENNIAIFFEKENINTLDAKGEILITILAGIAQQESQSISQNVSMGIRYKMREGRAHLNTKRFLGFTKNEEGDLMIIPEEAEIIRQIFRLYLEGCSPQVICNFLMAEKISSPTGNFLWYASTVARMLQNEKYAGDLLMQKSYTVDFLTHKKAKNYGALPQYYVKNAHAPIVPKEIFLLVQGERLRRGALRNDPEKIRMGAAMALSGRLRCGCCGRTLKRCDNSLKGSADWRCRKRAKADPAGKERCKCRIVPEDDAKRVILTAFEKLPELQGDLIHMLNEIRLIDLPRIDCRIQMLREDSPADVHPEERKLVLERAELLHREMLVRFLLELSDEIKVSENLKQNDTVSAACFDSEDFFYRTRHPLPEGLLDSQGRFTRFDDLLVIRHLDRVVVEEKRYQVCFKAGISVFVC